MIMGTIRDVFLELSTWIGAFVLLSVGSVAAASLASLTLAPVYVRVQRRRAEQRRIQRAIAEIIADTRVRRRAGRPT
jgi:hypothetical protein